ncbi:MAG: DUF58 domain-containing protein [Patescibacteria group bacterium]
MPPLALILAPVILGLVLRSLFTWRFLALAGLGVPFILLGARAGQPPTALLLAYDGLLFCACLLDYFLTPRPRRFTLTRRVDGVLSLGEPNRVAVEVEYRAGARSGYRTRLLVRDEPPPEFEAGDGGTMTAVLAPGRTALLSYTVRPPRRGLHHFGRLHLRYRGRLGLIVRQARYEAAAAVKVYPDVLMVKKFELLARAGRLTAMGLRAARLRGTGTNFESVREYVPGDEYRWINWKATARRGRPQTNEYQLEQVQNVFLLFDTGRMMVTRARGMARLDHAINAGLMLAYVAAGKGDRVGAMAFGEEILGYLAPGKGRGQVARLTEFLYPLQAEMVESDYARAFAHFAAKNHKRGLVCVFTDLIDEEVSGLLLAHMAALAPRHIPLCVALRDPLLDEAAREEIAEARTIYTKAVAEQVLADRARARRFLERRGVLVVDVPPEEMSVAVVNRYLELKERGRI